MKYLKIFEDFGDVNSICSQFGIENYTINNDGSIDVHGDVDLSDRALVKLPIKFREVSGGFYCHNNRLASLEGSPQSVGGGFYCYSNQLASLEGSPQSVGGGFDCSYNQLTSLEGSPQSVGGDFYCSSNRLASFEGGPQSVGGGFYCSSNRLASFEGGPQSVGGDFYCLNNPIFSIWKLFLDYSKVDLLNDYDPVRDGGVIILDRLNGFLQEIGKPEVTEVSGYKCI